MARATRPAKWPDMLPAAIVLLSILAGGAFLRYYLYGAARQFAASFEKQNLVAIESGDVYALSARLNALGAAVRAECVVGERGGQNFFRQGTEHCGSGPFRQRVRIESASQKGLRIDFTLRLPRALEAAGAVFLLTQIGLLALLFFGVRRAEEIRSEGARRLGELATQVAHDIRSPLAALETVLPGLASLPGKDRDLVTGAVSRIRSIAEDLLRRNRRLAAEAGGGTDLAAAARSVVEEWRLTAGGVTLEHDLAPVPAVPGVEASGFARVLSNLIGNAVEACGGSGRVRVALGESENAVVLSVSDDGPGIAPERLEKLGERGATFGKKDGSGLGLHHARRSAEAWGGRLEIESKVGEGTVVRLTVPLCDEGREAALVDDDPLVHMTWSAAARAKGKTLRGFRSRGEFLAAADGIAPNTPVYVDSDLGDGPPGEEFARTLFEKGYRRIFLTTGHSPESFPEMPWITEIVGKEPPWSQ